MLNSLRWRFFSAAAAAVVVVVAVAVVVVEVSAAFVGFEIYEYT